MPNVRGGKSYKKSKTKSGENYTVDAFLIKEDDQMVGRILKILGGLNVSVFCQDNKTRICKIALGIKKKVRFFTGDIVLISLRDCLLSNSDLDAGKRSNRGDVIGKYNQTQYNQLKLDGIPVYVFGQADTLEKIAEKFDEGDIKGALAIGNDETNNYVFESADNLNEPSTDALVLQKNVNVDDNVNLDSL
jgi:initiation factor 1A